DPDGWDRCLFRNRRAARYWTWSLKVAQTSVCDSSGKSQTEVCVTWSFRRDISSQVEQQVSRRRIDAELSNHSDYLTAVHRRVVGRVLHLIDQSHRAG